MPDLKANIDLWGRSYGWPQDGDEWQDQATACGVPYAEWKQALLDAFVVPYVGPETAVLEIGCGHGRWAAELIPISGRYTGIDAAYSCVNFCRTRFAGSGAIFLVNDGMRFPTVGDGEVDFIWSYDSFVHMESDVLESYLHEIRRVLGPGRTACIHHSGNPTPEQRRRGWRSAATGDEFAAMAAASGLAVEQSDSWGGRCHMRLLRTA